MNYEFTVKHPDGTEETGEAKTWRTHALVIWDGAQWNIEMLCETYTTAKEFKKHLEGIDFLDRTIRPVWDADSENLFTDGGPLEY